MICEKDFDPKPTINGFSTGIQLFETNRGQFFKRNQPFTQ